MVDFMLLRNARGTHEKTYACVLCFIHFKIFGRSTLIFQNQCLVTDGRNIFCLTYAGDSALQRHLPGSDLLCTPVSEDAVTFLKAIASSNPPKCQ